MRVTTSSRGSRWLGTAAILIVPAVLCGAAAVPTDRVAAAASVSREAIDRASIDHAVAADQELTTELETGLAQAQALYAGSAGLVAEENTRLTLSQSIVAATTAAKKMRTAAFLQSVAQTVVPDSAANNARDSLRRLEDTTSAVQRSEQQLAAQKAALAAATQRAAAARSRSMATRGPGRAPGTVTVWTSGFQTQINACRGAVDVTAHYGVRTIAEHWRCGGSSFPTGAGSVVTITGLDAGRYRVLGVVAVLNVHTASTDDLPRGYQLLFQTCRNGNSSTMEFVALQAA